MTRVVASPLQRAIATARAIADPHGLSVDIDDRLVELDYGDWDARGLRDVSPEEWDAWRADVHFTPPGGESLVSVTARVVEFCVEQAADGFTVAVSHVSPIKAAVCWALGVDERASWRMHLDLATVTRVGRRGNAPTSRRTTSLRSRLHGERDRAPRGLRVRARSVDDEPAFAETNGYRHAQRLEQRVIFLG